MICILNEIKHIFEYLMKDWISKCLSQTQNFFKRCEIFENFEKIQKISEIYFLRFWEIHKIYDGVFKFMDLKKLENALFQILFFFLKMLKLKIKCLNFWKMKLARVAIDSKFQNPKSKMKFLSNATLKVIEINDEVFVFFFSILLSRNKSMH